MLARNLVGDTATPGFPTQAGDSAWSNTASPAAVNPAPSAPTGVMATGSVVTTTISRVSLTWTDTSTTETGFRTPQSTNAGFTGPSVVTTTVAANTVRFRTANLPRAASYCFRIRSANAAGASAWVNASPFPVLAP